MELEYEGVQGSDSQVFLFCNTRWASFYPLLYCEVINIAALVILVITSEYSVCFMVRNSDTRGSFELYY